MISTSLATVEVGLAGTFWVFLRPVSKERIK